MIDLSSVIGLLSENDNFLILTHKRPDGDTLGSALALRELLCLMGKRAECLCPDRVEGRLALFTDGYDFSAATVADPYVISVDVASRQLLGELFDIYPPSLMIDHHESAAPFCENVYSDPAAAAAGEIIFEIARAAEKAGLGKMNAAAAKYIYGAISSDTGCFRFANTTSRTHRIAAELMEYGFDREGLDRLLHISKSPSRLALEGYIAQNLRITGRIGACTLSRREIALLGVCDEDISDIVDIPRSVMGVDLAFSVTEMKDGAYKVSFRSAGCDVAKLAEIFAGGGHSRAAGCTLNAIDIEDAYKKIYTECVRCL